MAHLSLKHVIYIRRALFEWKFALDFKLNFASREIRRTKSRRWNWKRKRQNLEWQNLLEKFNEQLPCLQFGCGIMKLQRLLDEPIRVLLSVLGNYVLVSGPETFACGAARIYEEKQTSESSPKCRVICRLPTVSQSPTKRTPNPLWTGMVSRFEQMLRY